MTKCLNYEIKCNYMTSQNYDKKIFWDNSNNSLHLYSAFLGTQSALHRGGGRISPRPPPVCSIHLDDVTAAIVHQNTPPHTHTPATGVMKPISVWGWLGDHGQRPVGGEFGFLMTRESQDLGLTSHPKDGAFYSIVSPSLHWGVRCKNKQKHCSADAPCFAVMFTHV